MKRSRGSCHRRPTARPRPLPRSASNFEADYNVKMEEMFGDLNLGQCTIPGSSDENGDPIMKPHFFSMIVYPSLHLRKLMIPPKFRNDHGSSLLSHAFLRAPEGKEHKVRVKTDKDGNLWFGRGWKDFADCYSLAFGSWLVFRYEGRSRFHVFVFDTSCTEIEYPNFNTGSIYVDEDEDVDEDEEQGEVRGAEERARDFRSNNPFFVSTMRKSYLSGEDFRMWVPAWYAIQHMMRDEYGVILLKLDENPYGKTWRVHFTCQPPKPGRLTTVRLTIGWKKFALRNNLEVGDVCVFELIDKEARIYKVHIFRGE